MKLFHVDCQGKGEPAFSMEIEAKNAAEAKAKVMREARAWGLHPSKAKVIPIAC